MTKTFQSSHYDAVVIGARCAGASTAMLLARAGARVLIVDRDRAPWDTLSTHALMRPAVSLLHDWGLLDRIADEGTPVVRRTQFNYGPECIDIPVRADGDIEGLYAPRRWLLDTVLRDAAVAAGAELQLGTALTSLFRDSNGRISGAELRGPDGKSHVVSADVIIGADGRQSSMAKAVDARVLAYSDLCSATQYTYVDGVRNNGYRWYFGDKVAAGLIPTTNGQHCLFTSCAPEAFGAWFREDAYAGMMRMLGIWEPELVRDLSSQGPAERIRRYAGAPGHIRDCAGPGWALVGDAGYFKDPATAHGITDAFLDADRLARSLIHTPGDARNYQSERDQSAPTLFRITQEIAGLGWDYDNLKTLHMELNACLKAEQMALTDASAQIALAA